MAYLFTTPSFNHPSLQSLSPSLTHPPTHSLLQSLPPSLSPSPSPSLPPSLTHTPTHTFTSPPSLLSPPLSSLSLPPSLTHLLLQSLPPSLPHSWLSSACVRAVLSLKQPSEAIDLNTSGSISLLSSRGRDNAPLCAGRRGSGSECAPSLILIGWRRKWLSYLMYLI